MPGVPLVLALVLAAGIPPCERLAHGQPAASSGAATASDAAPGTTEPARPSDASRAADTTPELDRCIEAFEGAQRLRRTGRLLESRSQMVTCAQPVCPTPIASRCVGWLSDVDRAIPTVVVIARAPDGRDTAAVRVWIDGEPRAERLDGRPWPLDPGGHDLRFEHPGSVPVQQSLLVAEGEKNRRVEVRFEALEPHRAPLSMLDGPSSPTSIVPTVSWTSVGIGVAALVVGAITGGLALDERAEIEERCQSGVCSADEVDRYRHGATLARVSTVSFIGAGVGLSVGLLTWLLSDATEEPTRASDGLRTEAARVELRVGPGALWVWGALP